ncbi:glycoside hydrolase [Globomyces pollinis-pini]|nr:glycoside hydrolase [Globomyces pollinis-pini]
MFSDAFDSYMKYAYPLDELDPINCKGNSRTKDSQDWYVNDVLGNYSLTLVDSLDALAIFGKQKEFEQSVKRVIQTVSFSKDVRVQVFEVTIRVLGGLLSAHLLATDATLGFKIDWYNGELLDLAEDLGQRLLPAFDTPFGIPYPRVNLKSGVMSYEVREACVAGAGTLILEFGALSRLTGNYIYEEKAKIALFEIWRRRTDIGLVGNTMNIFSETVVLIDIDKQWVDEMSGVGAGSDSFFEYLFKAYVLLGGKEYLDTYQSAYEAIMKHIVDGDGFIFKSVSAFSGKMITAWVDSLSAFFPGLQVLSGHLEDSIHPHLLYATIWKKYGALPERFNFQTKSSVLDYYPLRPELIESTYMLYQATKDHFYLELGERILNDIQTHAKVKCGYASIKNVEHKTHDPRMESFFLSETLKYLYLLFDAGM